MVPANKILTVAYGTFSCTLEGFNDPFSTMTDIAEYFRDLAADDRFFGAEPPTPDMAMLRTIAETRAKHAVTAQPEEGGVTLRPTDMPAASALSAAFDAAEEEMQTAPVLTVDAQPSAIEEAPVEPSADTAAEAAAEAAAPSGTQVEDVAVKDEGVEAQDDSIGIEETAGDKAVAEETADDEAVVATTEQAPAEAEEDSVAAKLARIRDVVEADRQASTVYSEDEHVDDMLSDDDHMANDTLAAAFAADALEDAPMAEEAEDETGEDTIAADISAILTPHNEELSAAATSDEDTAQDADVDVELGTEVEPESIETPEAEVVPETVDVVAAQDAVEEAETEIAVKAEQTSEEDLTPRQRRIRVRKVRRVKAAAEAAAMVAAPEADVPAQETPEEEAVPLIADMEEVAPVVDSVPEVAEIEPEHASDDDELMSELAAIEAELTRDATGTDAKTDEGIAAAIDTSEDDDLMAELAAIRADDKVADASNDDIVASILGDDEENAAETAEDIAVIDAQADIADDVTEQETPAVDEPSVQETPEEAPVAAEFDDADEIIAKEDDDETVPSAPDMERLFAATDSRLSGEDTSRRHANISHLKAAVAARRADGPVEAKEETETDAYRADLASSVRPRRATPVADAPARTPRPERPAPLVLVSEQRVEEPADQPDAAPVQPRRAKRTAEVEVRDEALAGAEDFEAFASDVGASDLSDILEAAAVYSAKVMGQDNFSRPRLLHLAAEAAEDMSREDGLRGFGQLLRDGTIRKVSRGTFALATDSRFAEQADRRAG